mmetsp:Transcript_16960/g.34424  ORF Transcript_16960/g.34424 Transcript_16960/m.34424 type:complete len:973 (+) Transcript_16960:350-3268(+)
MEHRSISAPPIDFEGNSGGARGGLPLLYGLPTDRPDHERSYSDDILNIIGAVDDEPSKNNSNNEGFGTYINVRPRSLEDDKHSEANFFGLNIVRSQSAAPDIFSGASLGGGSGVASRLPYGHISSTSRSGASGSIQDENDIFSRSRFFDEEEEDREALMQAAARRPASTGVIGRPTNDSSDVNSILQTLGLAPSSDYTSENRDPHISSQFHGEPMGGIGRSDSLINGPRTLGKKSIMEKIQGGASNSMHLNHFNTDESDNFFSNQGGTPYQSGSNMGFHNEIHRSPGHGGAGQYTSSEAHSSGFQVRSYGNGVTAGGNYQNANIARDQQHRGINGFSEFNGGMANNNAYQTHHSQQTQVHQMHQMQQQHPSPYETQQHIYFQQGQPNIHAQSNHRPQQNFNGVPNPTQVNQGQPTIVQINNPNSPYGFEYHTIQQHPQHPSGAPANHIILPHHPPGATVGQPQYISIVPIQTSPVIGGSPNGAYAYVQYGGDGIPVHTQPTVVGGAPQAFVLGTQHISVSNPNGLAHINTGMHYGAGSTPPGTSRTPSMGGGGNLKSPDRGQRNGGADVRGGSRGRGGGLSSPRGKRGDAAKNATAVSKLGPVAANLLNEIRSAKSRNQWTIHDIQGHIVEFCLDQNGSRFIQQRLEVANANEKNAVMGEVIPAIKDLQNDVFGNYVVQKLFEFGTDEMKAGLKGTLKGNMLSLSLQMYGCRVVQKALESLDYEDLCELLNEFHQHVLSCIQDQNGNHVMQKCIEVMSVKAKEAEAQTGQVGLSGTLANRIQFIVDDVLANVEGLCCHPYGCRVLQRMLEHCVEFQKISTLDEIRLCHKTLLDDQYGNYVIQHVLQYGRESDRNSLLEIIVENDLLKLSRQKFASNVVEKLLKYGNSAQRNAIVREMLKVVGEGGASQEGVGSSVLLLMVRDAYANYVVQTAIDVVPEGNEKQMLLEELRENEVQLRNYTFAKHIVAKLGTK